MLTTVFKQHRLFKPLILAWLILMGVSTHALASERVSYTLSPESKLWFKGTSTLHDFTCQVNTIDLKLTMDSTLVEQATNTETLSAIDMNLSIPVKDIDSGKGSMNKNMYEALDAKDHPVITYTLDRIRAESANVAAGDSLEFAAYGNLTVAGETKEIRMEIDGELTPDKTIRLSGKKALRMTEFNIDPPSFMFGTLKTGDIVIVHFDMIFTPATPSGIGD
jgi:polyisoprenoid-binding protein YceI